MSWQDSAACAGTDPDLFFPPVGSAPRVYAAARKVCDGCPVVSDCAADVLANPAEYGMFAGLTPDERGMLRRRPRRVFRGSGVSMPADTVAWARLSAAEAAERWPESPLIAADRRRVIA